MRSQAPIVIVGGGLAGSLTAVSLREKRPELPILLIEADERFGGNHTWSFFDDDIPTDAAGLVAALKPTRWPRHRVRFPAYERELPFGYNSVASPALDSLVRRRLGPESIMLGAEVRLVEEDGVVLQSGERIAARAVIDARGPGNDTTGIELGWQKFVGIEFAASCDQPDCATIMDATLSQLDGYRFLYVLPFAVDRVLVEDTYYSRSPKLDLAEVGSRVRALARALGLEGEEIRHEEGVLPIVIGGDTDRFWPNEDRIARLGLKGGFFHQTTGYSFGMAIGIADDLSSAEGDLDGAFLAEWTRARFIEHWNSSRYHRLLNKMLFHAAKPDQRYRVFEHFYRLEPELVARFYAGSLTWQDKFRILSGKPPVPVGRALAAIAGYSDGAST
ncbi:MAG TPA: lycopene cyclase [Erythrobacter sp.]|nr:lycopene cyclase [Erythrobacter sp.]